MTNKFYIISLYHFSFFSRDIFYLAWSKCELIYHYCFGMRSCVYIWNIFIFIYVHIYVCLCIYIFLYYYCFSLMSLWIFYKNTHYSRLAKTYNQQQKIATNPKPKTQWNEIVPCEWFAKKRNVISEGGLIVVPNSQTCMGDSLPWHP